MLFSSFEFLYLFLPLTVGIYFVLRGRARNYVLLVASLVFYGIAQPRLLPLMVGVSLFDYLAGLLVWRAGMSGRERLSRALTVGAVALNIAVLFIFKYLDALLGFLHVSPLGIELPTGISFYTFQAMSYVIDVRRRCVRVQKNPALFLTYVSLFPQLVAGPIVRYSDVCDSLERRTHRVCDIAAGARLFCIGLGKKLLLANGAGEEFRRLALYSATAPSTFGAYLGLVFFAFQIYFDFSGYSDMARGLGKVFGFEFPENFRYPYISRSITEFWRRWHITLSAFFREYVYIPLGGNRRGQRRMYLNLLVVWLLTGVWHGASINFLLWGLYFFVLLAIEKAFLLKRLERAPRVLSHLYALIFIFVGWLIFASDGSTVMASAGEYFLQLLGVGCPIFTHDVLFELWRNLPYLAIMAFCATPIAARSMRAFEKRHPSAVPWLCNALSLVLFLLCNVYLADSGYNPFLYFKF